MTILFFLKPALTMPPSGYPVGAGDRKKRQKKEILRLRQQKLRREDDEIVLILNTLRDDEDTN